MCTHIGESPRAGQVWERNQDNSPKVKKDPEEMPYINDVTPSLLRSSLLGRMPTPFYLWMCIFALLLLSYIKKMFLCVHFQLLCYVSNNKLSTGFYSFCLFETFFFSRGARDGETLLLSSSLWWT